MSNEPWTKCTQCNSLRLGVNSCSYCGGTLRPLGFNHPLRYSDPPVVTYTGFVPVEPSEGTQWVDRADPMVGPFTSPADKLFADKICGQLERGETSVGAVIVGFTLIMGVGLLFQAVVWGGLLALLFLVFWLAG